MRPGSRTLLGVALLSAVVHAQDRGGMKAGTIQPFVFRASPSDIRDSKASPADVRAAEATARKLADVVTSVPSLNPPVGFHSLKVGVLMGPDATQARMRPIAPLDIWVRFGAPKNLGDEMNFLHFYVNDLRPVILDHLGLRKWEDARGDLYLEPDKTEEIGGFPMYNDLLVIARPGESIWAPLAVERFAKVLDAQLKADADAAEKTRERARADLAAFLSPAEQEKRRAAIDAARKGPEAATEVRRVEADFREDEAAIRRKIDPDPSNAMDVAWYFGPVNAYKDLQTVLAGLDAAGRGAPACVTRGERPERWRLRIVPDKTPGCRRVVEANLALFKPTLPRSAIQLITVENIKFCRAEVAQRRQKTPEDCAAVLEIVRQLNWQQVAALLEK